MKKVEISNYSRYTEYNEIRNIDEFRKTVAGNKDRYTYLLANEETVNAIMAEFAYNHDHRAEYGECLEIKTKTFTPQKFYAIRAYRNDKGVVFVNIEKTLYIVTINGTDYYTENKYKEKFYLEPCKHDFTEYTWPSNIKQPNRFFTVTDGVLRRWAECRETYRLYCLEVQADLTEQAAKLKARYFAFCKFIGQSPVVERENEWSRYYVVRFAGYRFVLGEGKNDKTKAELQTERDYDLPYSGFALMDALVEQLKQQGWNISKSARTAAAQT